MVFISAKTREKNLGCETGVVIDVGRKVCYIYNIYRIKESVRHSK